MRILVGMSGGVDSAYAASLLLSEGHDVEGAVLKMHDYTELSSAREAALSVGIPLHEIDCTHLFDLEVKDYFVREYKSGRTPNPCIICNERVKMRALYDYALRHGFDKIATGHYGRVVISPENGAHALAVAEDPVKDQSYMLYRLPEEILSALLLPLSRGKKEEVRGAAALAGISVANKKDSQEICFLPDGNHAEFVEERAGKCPGGNFIDSEGNVLGRHKGIVHYTVGQRKGLGIALGKRMFVTAIDSASNTVTLSPEIKGREVIPLCDTVFSGMDIPAETVSVRLEAKLRYTASPVSVTASISPTGEVTLISEKPVTAAPGQSAVLYKNGVVMLGGIIC